MPQSLAQLYIHLIFSTKKREPFIRKCDMESLSGYIVRILQANQSPSLIIGPQPDHIHILYRQSKNHALVDTIRDIKTESSKWIKTIGRPYNKFAWQTGYGAFSVSASKIPAVQNYISTQDEHHRNISFQDEFRRFLKEYEVSYDERYVWD